MRSATGCKIQPIDRNYNRHGGGRKVHLEFYRPGISNTILANERSLVCISESEMIAIEQNDMNGIRVRKLIPLETWRLMGFTDEDFFSAMTGTREVARDILTKYPHDGKRRMTEAERVARMSNTQLYKQAGNSIVVDVLRAIMRKLYDAMPYLFEDMVVGSFFSGIGAFEKALSTFDTPEATANSPPVKNDGLIQIGYINRYNGDANRIYDGSAVARSLKAEAGGGWSKDGMVHNLTRQHYGYGKNQTGNP